LRRPQHPFASLGIHEQRQDFLAVRKPEPADRAVAIGGGDVLAAARNVHAPGDAGPAFAPELVAVLVVGPDVPFRAEHETIAAGRDRDRTRHLV